MPPAVAAAGIGAAGSIGGALISSRASRRGAAGARFDPTSINMGPFGNTSGFINRSGQLNYNTNPGEIYGGIIPQFADLASGGLGGALDLQQGTGGFAGLTPELFDEYRRAQDAVSGPGVPDFFAPQGQQGFQRQAAQSLGLSRLGGLDAARSLNEISPLELSGQNFLGAGNQALGALGNFDLNAATQQEFGRLNELARPGEVTETQGLFNKLQGLGRLGLTQNGELGDIGGLDLSQRLAANSRLGLARQSALGQQQQLGDFANMFGGRGSNLFAGADAARTSAVGRYGNLTDLAQQSDLFGFNRLLGQNNLATQNALTRFGLAGEALGLGQSNLQGTLGTGLAGLTGLQSIQDQLRAGLETSINASTARAGAGANAGMIAQSGANNTANVLGNLSAGLLSNPNLFRGSVALPSSAGSTNPGQVGGPIPPWIRQ